MKKFLIAVNIMLLSFLVGYNLQYLKTKEVLLVGEIIGLEIDNETQSNETENLIPASAKRIGTVTFIDKNTGKFVALGHSAINQEKIANEGINGNCYGIEYFGITKASQKEVGSVHATLDTDKKIGYISEDSDYGVFGKIEKIEKEYRTIKTASRYSVRLGNAEIYTNINGEETKSYQVEVIYISYLSQNKNIKIRIKDQELIEKTGGIIQGMSGTPLIQNGKLIGAINYVNMEDPTEACAIFVDKLI